jgi:hypothetical protein
MMKRLIGFEALQTLGKTPSKMPPCGVALVAVGFTEATVAVDEAVVVMDAMTPDGPARARTKVGARSRSRTGRRIAAALCFVGGVIIIITLVRGSAENWRVEQDKVGGSTGEIRREE